MLVLGRKVGQEIVVPQLNLVFTILEVQGDKVRVGIAAPRDIKVHRREVWEQIQAGIRGKQAGEPIEVTLPLEALPTHAPVS